MNGGAEINENELLDLLERILPTQFAKLLFKLKVPKPLLPPETAEQTYRAIALLEWARTPGGCGLSIIKQYLKEMGITNKVNCIQKVVNKNEIHQIVRSRLFNFDHKTTLITFREVVDRLASKENAGIFILPQCLGRGGTYCTQRLINYLKEPSVTSQGKFHLKNITYLSGEATLKGLLCRLGYELKIERELESLPERDVIGLIIRGICSAVPENDAGNTYLFYIRDYDILLKDNFFWDDFINNFWNILIKNIELVVRKHRRLKLIFLFESTMEISVDSEYICTSPEGFTRNKIVELPLKPCELEEIDVWLCDCSQLPLPIINTIIKICTEEQNRQPDRVYNLLQNRLIEYLENNYSILR